MESGKHSPFKIIPDFATLHPGLPNKTLMIFALSASPRPLR